MDKFPEQVVALAPVVGPVEGAKLLGISKQTFCRLCQSGEIEAVKIGRQWRVGRDWLLKYAGLGD